MAESILFSDTLDNFTFQESQLLEQSCRRNILKSFKDAQDNSTVVKITCKSSITPTEANITLDDSAFFNTTFELEDNKPISLTEIECRNKSIEDTSVQHNTQQLSSATSNHVSTDSFISLCTQEKCMISSWGLPLSIQQKYESCGIFSMFKWQAECLSNKKLLEDNGNLIYSAPTSAGKTLVAEIIAIKTVLERQKKVLIILPFVSVVREKMFYFQDLLGGSGVRVEGFMGSYRPPGGFSMVQVAICTIEKANSIVNRCLEEGTLSEIGAVVVDEMHLLGDPSRGYLLELTLTKLQYMCAREANLNIQIIGMSATLPNLDSLARWLNADLYTTNFRPIPLLEQYLVNSEIYNNSFQLERKLTTPSELDTDTDHILQLCLETIDIGCSVLIFCPTKNWCENLAQQIACAIWKLGQKDCPSRDCLKRELKSGAIKEVLEQLKRSPVGLDAILNKTISFGVAFHHAGLTMDERDIIEGGFRSGTIRVLIATSTLSSGVNLPARRVIVRTPLFHGKPIDILTYRQMIGRAGRMGKDSAGESILVCQKNDGRIVKELMSSELESIESCLEGAGKLKRAILEVIASGVVSSPEDVQLFTQCTLLAQSSEEGSQLISPIAEAVDFLKRNEFIRLQESENGTLQYVATSLAKACLSSSIPPEDGLTLFAELEKARQCFVLDNELHLIYLVTPYSCSNQWFNLDWMHYLDMWEKLPTGMKKVGNLIGVQEAFIFNGTRGRVSSSSNKQFHKLQIHKRFYTALALQELVNEVPLSNVAAKFNCSRGMLQSLQQSASTFAGMVTAFSRQLGWSNVELLISQFQDRLQFGVNRDLLDLMKLSLLDGPRARILYKAGIQSLIDLAAASVCSLENIFYEALPFETGKERDGETESDAQKRNKVRTFWITGKEGLTEREAAELLISEARRFLTLELGLAEAKWDTKSISALKPSSVDGSSTSSDTNTKLDLSGDKTQKSLSVQSKIAVPKLIKSEQFKTSTPENSEKFSGNTVNTLNKDVVTLNNSTTPCSPILYDDLMKTNLNNVKLQSELNGNLSVNDSDKSGSLFENDCDLNNSLHISQKMKDLSLCKSPPQEILPKENIANDLYFSDDSLFEKAFISGSEESIKKCDGSNESIDSSFHLRYSDSMEMFDDSDDLVLCSQEEKDILKSVTNSAFYLSKNWTSEKIENEVLQDALRKRERVLNSTNGDGSFEETPKKKFKVNIERNNNANFRLDFGGVAALEQENKFFRDFHDCTQLKIVKVCSDVKCYRIFQEEMLKQKEISLAVACKKFESNAVQKIGNKLYRKPKMSTKENTSEPKFFHDTCQVVGVAFNWGNNEIFYLSLENSDVFSCEDKLLFLQKVLSDPKLTLKTYGSKQHIKVIKKCLNIDLGCNIIDPSIADWMLNPEELEKSLKSMVELYLPNGTVLFESLGKCRRFGSLALDIFNDTDPEIRAAYEAFLTWHLVDKLKSCLKAQDPALLKTYEIEMRSILCLTNLEIHGIEVNRIVLEEYISKLKELMLSLEKEAYGLAGKRFSFSSSKEVAKILGIYEVYQGRRISTAKKTLETVDHPIAPLIIQWRKIQNIMTKMLYPLVRAIVTETDRIYGCCITHNATGRISMQEPNLQNTPRDFDVNCSNTTYKISIRKAFVPGTGKMYVSADYCQLELRLLSHFSQDSVLCLIMRSEEDVFKSVAAKWNGVTENEVDDTMRQRAKQICYGIIYGMGTVTLAKHLGVESLEAASFIEKFKSTYPGITKFVNKTIADCKRDGFVATISHRRRYLPLINDLKCGVQNQAERQAVNTTIQGSAADIAKRAMVAIEKKFQERYSSPYTAKNRPNLVLHIHDELLYEVAEDDVASAASIIKECMEGAVKLSIPLPVKLKCGNSWGTLKEITLL